MAPVSSSIAAPAPQSRAPGRIALALLPLAFGLAQPLGAAPVLPAPADPARALAVEVVEAKRAPSLLRLAATGTVEAADVLAIAFPTGGRVLALHADIGDRVKRGALLAELDPVQASAALRAAEAQLSAAEASLLQSNSAYERAQGLIERGATTRASLERAEQEWRGAQAQLDEAKAGRDKALQALNDTRILAPGDGVVTARSGEVGQVTGAGQALFRIAADGPREAQFHLPALPGLEEKLGETLEIRSLDGTRDATRFTAVISEISPLVDTETGTIAIRARLEGAGAGLGLGTPLGTALQLDGPPVVSLPAAALISDLGAPAVWVIDPATAKVSLTRVGVARFTSDRVEIDQGLEDGLLVAGAGAQLLFPGRSVIAAEVSP